MLSLLRRCIFAAESIPRQSTRGIHSVSSALSSKVLPVRTSIQSERSISSSVPFTPLLAAKSNSDKPSRTGEGKTARTFDYFDSRYSSDVFFGDNGCGGHVIYSSEDPLNPLRSEIRFSSDAVPHYFPYVWLRDHCRCAHCADREGHSRVATDKLTSDIVPVLGETNNLGQSVSILWKDGHVSRYPSRWLWANRFDEKTPRDVVQETNVVRWNAKKIGESLQRFDFRSLLENDELLFDWLMSLQAHGLAVIRNVPETPNQLHVLGDRVGFLRQCYFGLSFEENVRDDAGGLSFHTDLPYMSSPPRVSLIRLIAEDGQPENGGAMLLLSDGFNASDILQDEMQDSCEVLSKIYWEYANGGFGAHGNYHQRAKHPMIEFNNQARVMQVVINDRMRRPKMNVSTENVPPAYQSLKQYINIMERPENVFKYSLNPGEILSRDNHRVLYKWAPVGQSQRSIEGVYIDWDEVISKLRVLYGRFTGS